jgi:uncharacterized protein DUF2804
VTVGAGACTEPELGDPVDLCTSDGDLNPSAIGWSRLPVHRCALPGSWGRRKRWDFWGITGPGCVMNITYADVDYLGLADVWFCDLQTKAIASSTAPSVLGRAMALPERVAGADMHAHGRALDLSIVEEPAGTRLRASFGRGAFDADVLVHRPEGHESLSVVIPWSRRRFQFTNKDVARPAEGTVRYKDATYTFTPDGTSWGCLDFGRGKWPYRTHWNWGAGAGMVQIEGRPVTVGVQLGGKWTDGTGMTENALCVDGRLSKLSEELIWTYDTSDWLRPWTIRTPSSDRVDLRFTPVYDKRSRLSLGIASSSVDQCFGTYSGTVVPDDGRTLVVDGLFGWAEEATWRW